MSLTRHGFLSACHSERSEESTATNVAPRVCVWILRCAQNDNRVEDRPDSAEAAA